MSYDTLIDKTKFENGFLEICNAIRAKTGGHDGISFPGGMVRAINSIPAGEGTGNIEISRAVPPDLPHFSGTGGTVEVWGWGKGPLPPGTPEWQRSNYIFIGNKWASYIPDTDADTTSMKLSIAPDGSITGIPELESGELIAIRAVK